ncbi:MAG: hemolysin family protein [Spirochaetes bacterium]|nr:hemolysin family protein [Spirochaetota bacterium]
MSKYNFFDKIFHRKKQINSNNNYNYINEILDPDFLKSLTNDQIKMIKGIAELYETSVHEIMKPRIDVITFDINDPIKDFIELVVQCGHSRIPVYDGNIDNIIGVVYVKDLLQYFFHDLKNINLRDIIREPLFVPESKKISDLLKEFKDKKKHIALVVDEYGGFSGIVCLEDILEEIVGEIRDEYDNEKDAILKIDDKTYRVSAKASIYDLNEILNINLPEDLSDSIGGFIMETIGRIPIQGEEITYKNLKIKVEKMRSYKIESIIISILEDNNREG